MSTTAEMTPEGIVVRIARGKGACRYRKNFDGNWEQFAEGAPDRGWRRLNSTAVPATALRVVAKAVNARLIEMQRACG